MGELSKEDILNNIEILKARIKKACETVGRDSSSVKLLMATKTVSAENIRIAIESGQTLIGENKVQEFKKHNDLSDLVYEKHLTGNLQTNKVNEVLRSVSCIQTVDRISLVEKLHQKLSSVNKVLDIMVQVNTSGEESKSGVAPNDAINFIKEIKEGYNTLNIIGLMTIGLYSEVLEESRPSYKLLSDISKEIIKQGILKTNKLELSMGMSGDLAIAIQEGATMLRVGSCIFGERKY